MTPRHGGVWLGQARLGMLRYGKLRRGVGGISKEVPHY
jgi:hypothetical protein